MRGATPLHDDAGRGETAFFSGEFGNAGCVPRPGYAVGVPVTDQEREERQPVSYEFICGEPVLALAGRVSFVIEAAH